MKIGYEFDPKISISKIKINHENWPQNIEILDETLKNKV